MEGWNEEKVSDVNRVLQDAYDVQYELENCVRGAFTGCTTYQELGDYLKELAGRLMAEADCLTYQEEDPEDEE